ncbi:MAG TPA: phosphate ABC transporter permease PstA, partial [Nocardioides sp.]|nr:phosphate ABC transporter permease PstA [Nocardioides sp.]
MTTVDFARPALTRPRLPRLAPLGVFVVVAAVAVLFKLVFAKESSWTPVVVLADVLGIAVVVIWSQVLEGGRAAKDRLVTGVIWSMFAVVCVPLVWIIELVVRKGGSHLSWTFLTSSMKNHSVLTAADAAKGGIAQALIGTGLITLVAALIAVPLGLMAAIYLVEYGKGTRLARATTLFVDVMTGIPSIVAGLFAITLFRIVFGPTVQMGFTAAIALALLMTPTVVRSTEEMLRLVPADLREASWALGVPKWRTILKVVVPTSIGGIVTGVMLAVARVIGETAPLLVAVGYTASVQWKLFTPSEPMSTLPTFIINQYNSPDIVS